MVARVRTACAQVTAPTGRRRGRCACGDGPRRPLSALCDAVRAHPDVPADLRAEITASGHLAGVTYAGGATDAARGPRDAAACVGCVRARGEPELYEAMRRASTGDVREQRAREGRN